MDVMMELLLVVTVDHVEMAVLGRVRSFGGVGGEVSGFAAVRSRHVDYLLINLIDRSITMKKNMQIIQISRSFSLISMSNKIRASSKKFSVGEGRQFRI